MEWVFGQGIGLHLDSRRLTRAERQYTVHYFAPSLTDSNGLRLPLGLGLGTDVTFVGKMAKNVFGVVIVPGAG